MLEVLKTVLKPTRIETKPELHVLQNFIYFSAENKEFSDTIWLGNVSVNTRKIVSQLKSISHRLNISELYVAHVLYKIFLFLNFNRLVLKKKWKLLLYITKLENHCYFYIKKLWFFYHHHDHHDVFELRTQAHEWWLPSTVTEPLSLPLRMHVPGARRRDITSCVINGAMSRLPASTPPLSTHVL
jgi:hypothetical protein